MSYTLSGIYRCGPTSCGFLIAIFVDEDGICYAQNVENGAIESFSPVEISQFELVQKTPPTPKEVGDEAIFGFQDGQNIKFDNRSSIKSYLMQNIDNIPEFSKVDAAIFIGRDDIAEVAIAAASERIKDKGKRLIWVATQNESLKALRSFRNNQKQPDSLPDEVDLAIDQLAHTSDVSKWLELWTAAFRRFRYDIRLSNAINNKVLSLDRTSSSFPMILSGALRSGNVYDETFREISAWLQQVEFSHPLARSIWRKAIGSPYDKTDIIETAVRYLTTFDSRRISHDEDANWAQIWPAISQFIGTEKADEIAIDQFKSGVSSPRFLSRVMIPVAKRHREISSDLVYRYVHSDHSSVGWITSFSHMISNYPNDDTLTSDGIDTLSRSNAEPGRLVRMWESLWVNRPDRREELSGIATRILDRLGLRERYALRVIKYIVDDGRFIGDEIRSRGENIGIL